MPRVGLARPFGLHVQTVYKVQTVCKLHKAKEDMCLSLPVTAVKSVSTTSKP